MMIKRFKAVDVAFGLAILLAGFSGAFAQCSGQFQPGRVCGNGTGALGLPGPILVTPSLFQPFAGGTVLGNPSSVSAVPIATPAPVLGIPGSVQGSLGLAGVTSGTITILGQAAAGTYNFNLPTSAGSAGQMLRSGGGGASPMNFTAATWPSVTTINQLLYSSSANTVAGLATTNGGILNAGATGVPALTVTPVLGVPGASQGTMGFAGATSGTAVITAQAVAGAPTLTLPNASGTFAVNASTPLVLSATTGGLTCPTCVTSSGGGAITGTAPISVSGAGVVSLNTNGVTYSFFQQVPALSLVGNGTNALANAQSLAGTANQIARVNGAGTTMGFGSIDLSQSAAVGASILSLPNGGSNAALTASNGGIVWSNASQMQILAGTATARLPLLSGATATPVWGAYTLPASVTSGGIPFFSSTSAEGSSGLLTANAIMLGGGAGAAPSTLGSLGTATTVLHGNAAGAPTFGQVVGADIATNTVANSNLAQAAANTMKGNWTGSTANVSDNAMPTCADISGNHLNYVLGTGITCGNTSSGGGGSSTIVAPQGRLTLQTGTPVMTTSATAVGTVYYDAYVGNQVPYYNGTADTLDTIASNEVSTTMVSAASAGQVVSGQVYDVWWVHGGANRICLAMSSAVGGGGGWASDTGGSNTARGTGYSQIDRVTRSYATNKNSITNCFNGATNYGPVSANQGTYLGTIYATANGQTSWTWGTATVGGGPGMFAVWNMYNRVSVSSTVSDPSQWTYAATTFRAADNSAGNRNTFVSGLAEDYFQSNYGLSCQGNATTDIAQVGIGYDVTNAYSGTGVPSSSSNPPVTSGCSASFQTQAVGVHFMSAIEKASGAVTVTYYGVNGNVNGGLTLTGRM